MNRSCALAAAAAALLACSHAKVETQFDPKAEFARYRTWAWVAEQPGPEQAEAVRNPAVMGLVRQAVERELGARGLARASGPEPDLLVAVLGFAHDRIEVTHYGYAEPVAYGWYSPPGAYGTNVQQYREGTLVLDLVDARTKQLVWRGTATDTVSSTSQVPAVIDAAVKDMLASYPPKGARSP
jgi:hypothetical protein